MPASTTKAGDVTVTWTTFAGGSNPDVNITALSARRRGTNYLKLDNDSASIAVHFSFDGTTRAGTIDPVSGGGSVRIPIPADVQKIWFALDSVGSAVVRYAFEFVR